MDASSQLTKVLERADHLDGHLVQLDPELISPGWQRGLHRPRSFSAS
jgi:hypothetical protein